MIEMLIVLMIISVLIILIIPNLSEKSENVHDKGCEALISLVQAQANTYHIDENEYPKTIQNLAKSGYIDDNQKTCPNGAELSIDKNNNVISNE